MNDTYLQLVKIRLQAAEINRRAELLGPSLVALGDRASPAIWASSSDSQSSTARRVPRIRC